MKKILILCFLLLLCLSTFIGCTSESSKTFPPPEGYSSWEEYNKAYEAKVTTANPIKSQVPILELLNPSSEPSPKTETETYHLITITGSGDKTSPPFTVTTKEWIIDWSYSSSDLPEHAAFSFFVYPRDETRKYVESVSSADIKGSTYLYAGKGDYYIKILATKNIDNWQIIIKLVK